MQASTQKINSLRRRILLVKNIRELQKLSHHQIIWTIIPTSNSYHPLTCVKQLKHSQPNKNYGLSYIRSFLASESQIILRNLRQVIKHKTLPKNGHMSNNVSRSIHLRTKITITQRVTIGKNPNKLRQTNTSHSIRRLLCICEYLVHREIFQAVFEMIFWTKCVLWILVKNDHR